MSIPLAVNVNRGGLNASSRGGLNASSRGGNELTHVSTRTPTDTARDIVREERQMGRLEIVLVPLATLKLEQALEARLSDLDDEVETLKRFGQSVLPSKL
jgi:hypothetical protein